eukprot:CAMPEP_0172733910 /NCGR_PEP_ID=MMETSP1074-20121228/108462_1 /TAXON_ID=2916 /ORGANISM="Ceratium fusus, Strain PA161109" /LENGTH=47 /DNA_ID=CAMNT_0013562563 /DNA_START=604 /DNA_END=744 /DNA_ORIENTATION=+
MATGTGADMQGADMQGADGGVGGFCRTVGGLATAGSASMATATSSVP